MASEMGPDSSSSMGRKAKSGSLFGCLPGILVGMATGKRLSDCDLAKSPTSPLDWKLLRSPTSPAGPGGKKLRSWDCGGKVGLSLVGSLVPPADDDTKACSKFSGSSGSGSSRDVLFGSQMRLHISSIKANLADLSRSLPKDYFFPAKGAETVPGGGGGDVGKSRFHESSKSTSSETFPEAHWSSGLDLFPGSIPILGSHRSSGLMMFPLSASEIEQSEDYTCIITRGPNPKTKHIFGDLVIESDRLTLHHIENKIQDRMESSFSRLAKSSVDPAPDDFLSFCYSCKNKLHGKDIYIYRGDRAFCSCDCREREMQLEENNDVRLSSDPAPANSWEEWSWPDK